jgi:hypothetical protein
MNCKEFEAILNDLACEHLMLASKRVQALAHQESCARCAARLAEERLLSERLRLVAESEVIETPARVKASLMAAFAERHGSTSAPPAAVPIRFAPAELAQAHSAARWSRRSIAAAAAILILLAVVSLRLLSGGASTVATPDLPMNAQGKPGSAPRVEPPADEPSPRATNPGGAITKDKSRKELANEQSGRAQGIDRLAVKRQARKSETNNGAVNQLARNEVVTDYIPLTYLNDSTAFDSGLVVRVQVPRSTLISMGLPMNVETSHELVKADVVVGDDGVARAIRFVHDLTARSSGK